MKKFKFITISDFPIWRIDTLFMRNYNYVFINLGRVSITIGRPIIPLVNKMIDVWEESRLNKIRLYYIVCKEQIDCSILLDMSDIRKDWMVQTTIKEMEQSVPQWLKSIISNHLERYYEREFRKHIKDKSSSEGGF